jgi:hypothetical protein
MDVAEWDARVLTRALAAWLLSTGQAQGVDRSSEPPVSVRTYEDEHGRFVVISGPGAGVRAVFGIRRDGRITRLPTWPDEISGCLPVSVGPP